MITVTANHEFSSGLARKMGFGGFPGYWYELPALRYGIHSTELFSRAVSFTGNPIVGSVVVDATGGSVYTGLGEDPLLYRDYLTPVEVHPPTAQSPGALPTRISGHAPMNCRFGQGSMMCLTLPVVVVVRGLGNAMRL